MSVIHRLSISFRDIRNIITTRKPEHQYAPLLMSTGMITKSLHWCNSQAAHFCPKRSLACSVWHTNEHADTCKYALTVDTTQVARLVTGCVRTHSCVRETCVRRLPAALGVTGCRGSLPFAQECRLGVWFGVGCTASCGWNVRCVGVRGDAWSVMLSPCNTYKLCTSPELSKSYMDMASKLFTFTFTFTTFRPCTCAKAQRWPLPDLAWLDALIASVLLLPSLPGNPRQRWAFVSFSSVEL